MPGNKANLLTLSSLILLSIFWGLGYTEYTRYPLYFYISLVIIITYLINIKVNYKSIFFIIVFGAYNLCIANSIESYLYPLIIIIYIIILSSAIKFLLINLNVTIEHLFIKTLYSSIFILCTLLSINYITDSESFYSGPYPEPSHLGYSFGPIFALLLSQKANGNESRITFLCLLIVYLISPSATLFVSLFIGLAVFNIHRIPVNIIIFLFSLLLIIILLINSQLFLSVISEWKVASYLIWLNGIERGLASLILHPFGVGVFGWISGGEIPVEHLGQNHDLMNQRDLVSSLPFFVSSYGIIGVLVFIYLFKYLLQYSTKPTIDMLLSKLLIIYLLTSIFRWAGPTLNPFLPLLALLISVRRLNA